MKWLLASVVVLVVAVGLVVLTAGSGPSGPPSTDTHSSEVAALEDRRTFVTEYLGPLPYADLEDGAAPDSALVFHVAYQNNNGGMVPGPSDWTTKVVARVPTDSLEVWLRGLERADGLDTSWLRELGPGPRVDGIDEWYGGPFRMVGLDRERGVVAAYASTM